MSYLWGQIVDALGKAGMNDDQVLDVQYYLCHAHVSPSIIGHSRFDRRDYLALRRQRLDDTAILLYWNEATG
jgi:hypothetical protein